MARLEQLGHLQYNVRRWSADAHQCMRRRHMRHMQRRHIGDTDVLCGRSVRLESVGQLGHMQHGMRHRLTDASEGLRRHMRNCVPRSGHRDTNMQRG